jgi:hypothetical protein
VAAPRDGPEGRGGLTGVVSVAASWLAILALLAFAVSLVALLYRTSRHRSSRAWAMATGGFLVRRLGKNLTVVHQEGGDRTRVRLLSK